MTVVCVREPTSRSSFRSLRPQFRRDGHVNCDIHYKPRPNQRDRHPVAVVFFSCVPTLFHVMLAARRAIIFGSGELSPTDEHSLFASENGFVMLATVDDEIGLFLQKETFGHAMRCALCVCCLLSWVANSKCSTPNLGLLTGIKAGLDRWMGMDDRQLPSCRENRSDFALLN